MNNNKNIIYSVIVVYISKVIVCHSTTPTTEPKFSRTLLLSAEKKT